MRATRWVFSDVLVLAVVLLSGAALTRKAEAAPGTASDLALVNQALQTDGTDQATLTWTTLNQGSQTLLIATTPNFISGTVVTSDTLTASRDNYVWPGLKTNTSYYARIDTQTPGGPVSSPTLGFVLQGVAPYPPGYTGNYYFYNPSQDTPAFFLQDQPITGSFTP
jgi:hypothetical protein